MYKVAHHVRENQEKKKEKEKEKTMSVDLPHNRNELKVTRGPPSLHCKPCRAFAQRRREGAVQGLTYTLFLYSIYVTI